ncbi:TRAUB-domain-containing protein [Patellaria atrata CBS 101060]|uniref:Protein BFR2 n=1 Tax=Patellaria atrata CBS 101060 TaxID=1346257 RepID=A0A9P4VLE5_9PEZI|nr:TRAUB-domain-containing protein [Patellaria atrata CBS 101060]
MSKSKRVKSLAEQIAELEDPAPRDFDPEEDDVGSESDAPLELDDEGFDGREHYVDVGKSKLQKRDALALGPQYEGSRINRDAIEDEDDDPFSRGFGEEDSEEEGDLINRDAYEGNEDEEKSAFDDEGQWHSEEDDEDMNDGFDSEGMEDEGSQTESDASEPSDIPDQNGIDRDELRALLASEQKTVAASLSQAAKTDADKGRAVKTQRATFDSLLNSRIRLQKSLVAVNSLSALPTPSCLANDTSGNNLSAFESAESAAFALWTTLDNLRCSLYTSRTGEKRKRSTYTMSTPTSSLWKAMETQEAAVKPHRDAVLAKWSAKARSTTGLPTRRLNASVVSEQTIVDVLRNQLTDIDRLVAKTKVARSCAPVQQKAASAKPARSHGKPDGTNGVADASSTLNNTATLINAEDIYDDADFYTLLLSDLLSSRSTTDAPSLTNLSISGTTPWQAAREAKTKKNVDTRASKGRKMRYTVHEKLQNFMAPEDRSTWGPRAADELFSGLFGKKAVLGEEVESDSESENENEREDDRLLLADGIEGVRLFR